MKLFKTTESGRSDPGLFSSYFHSHMLRFFFAGIFSLSVFFRAESQSLDLRILKDLNAHNYPKWDNIMWGTSASIFVVMPATILFVSSDAGFHNDNLMKRNAVKTAITIGFAALTTTTLKYTIRRPRPKTQYPDQIVERDRAGQLSFPSGHTTTAFATATALTLTYPKWYVAVPAYLYAGLVGYSRMRLGMHFPTDVLGGIVVGIGSGLLTWQLDRMINKK